MPSYACQSLPDGVFFCYICALLCCLVFIPSSRSPEWRCGCLFSGAHERSSTKAIQPHSFRAAPTHHQSVSDVCSASEGQTAGNGKDSKQRGCRARCTWPACDSGGRWPANCIPLWSCVCERERPTDWSWTAFTIISRTHTLSLSLSAAGSHVMLSHPLSPACVNYTHDAQMFWCKSVSL